MKTTIASTSDRKAKTRRRLTKKQRGVAIITVLAVIVLMSALVLSFFQMSQSEQVSSKINADVLRSYSLRDTAINLAIGQIREATAPTTAKVNDRALWTSQPGLIRTFQKDGTNGLNFKLYSAMNMVVDGTANESSMLDEDQAANWKNQDTVWVDLNQPVYRPKANASGAALKGNAAQTGTAIYPIMDPSAYDPARSMTGDDPNPEGLEVVASNKVGGVTPGKAVPMPVRWLYLLEDGTVGYLNPSGVFTAQAGGKAASANNPIIGRIAFWADDESCKINVNTASEGVFWDTPRCDTPEERYYANCQPTANEYMRYPGHPAGVCLSSVLFPHKRYYGTGPVDAAGTKMFVPPNPPVMPLCKAMTAEELAYIWDLAPMSSYRAKISTGATGASTKEGQPAGTVGGIVGTTKAIVRSNMSLPANLIDTSASANPDDHLYTSPDEMIFRAVKGGTTTTDRVTWAEKSSTMADARSPEATLNKEKLLTRMNRGKFLLTSKSSAPEVNMFGHPRISLWPLLEKVPNNTATGTITSKGGTAGATVYDTVIALTTQLNPTNYYGLSRLQSDSRHGEFYSRAVESGNNGKGINIAIWDYLRLATGHSDGSVTVGKLPGVAGKLSFREKYTSNSGNEKYTDMSNIIVNMLDYIRMTNLTDPMLASGGRYSANPGQITAFCGCGGTGTHAANWAYAGQPDPKGVGRTFAPNKMHWIIMKAGNSSADGKTFVNPIANTYGIDYAAAAQVSSGTTPYAKNAQVYEMGIVVEGACPAQGLTGVMPNMLAAIGGGNPIIGDKNIAALMPQLCIENNAPDAADTLRLANRTLTVQTVGASGSLQAAVSNAGAWPIDIPNYGGSQGFRAFSNSNAGANNSLILFKPFAIVQADPAAPIKQINFKSHPSASGDFTNWENLMFRLMVFDGATDVNNLVQSFYFNFGKPYEQVTFGLPGVTSTKTLNQTIAELYNVPQINTWKNLTGLAKADPATSTLSIHTMLMPHADYRAGISRRVLGSVPGKGYSLAESGVGNKLEVDSVLKYGVKSKNDVWNSFVPTPNFGKPVANAYLIYDPMVGMLDAQNPALLTRGHPAYTKVGDINNVLPPNAMMDYAFDYKDFQQFLDPAQRKRRGSMDPAITGDFNNGVANTPDGAYIEKADEGDLRVFFNATGGSISSSNDIPYFGAPNPSPKDISSMPDTNLGKKQGVPTPSFSNSLAGAAAAGPNSKVKGPVEFGSIATGSSTNAINQSLLFRPDPFGGNPAATAPGDATYDNRHFGGSLNPDYPKDHLLLDFFWMPVVEPYAISDTFSTKGKINMNYKIFPFDYIHRATALHALFKAEKILAIPTAAASTYKLETPVGEAAKNDDTARKDKSAANKPDSKQYWRKYIHAEKTLWQFDRKFNQKGEFSQDKSHAFRTPSEICDLWLIPESLGTSGVAGLQNVDDNPYQAMRNFWLGIPASVSNASAATLGPDLKSKRTAITDLPDGHRLTGDNSKEAPYANLYPRLTTKSNVFKVHYTVQTLQKARSTDVDKFVAGVDLVTSEYRGSAMIERTLDMTNPNLKNIRYLTDPQVFNDPKKRLDYFYSYRITEIKQFAP